MVGATVLGVFLQGLPHDRRVAMARVASLIRRAARGVRESKRLFYTNYAAAPCLRWKAGKSRSPCTLLKNPSSSRWPTNSRALITSTA